MKKIILMAAAFLLMTQCKKQESLVTPELNTVKMTVTAGPGRTDIGTTGGITWKSGDKLYVGYEGICVGYLDLSDGAGFSQGTFSGDLTMDMDNVTEGQSCDFKFFYLGSDNDVTLNVGDYHVDISFDEQDITMKTENGKNRLDGAEKFHIGHGSASAKVTGNSESGYEIGGMSVSLKSDVAIAHLKFNAGSGSDDIIGPVTVGGVYNRMTVNFDGSITGANNGSITLVKGSTDRYVMLVPAEGKRTLSFQCGGVTGSKTFDEGIQANKFYGMSNAIEVFMGEEINPSFSVSSEKKVLFSKGNLWYDGLESQFHFEDNQWGYSLANSYTTNHISYFMWNEDSYAFCFGAGYDYYEHGELFCANDFTVSNDNHEDWRTLTRDEWDYLLGINSNSEILCKTEEYGRLHAKDLCAFSKVTFDADGTTVSGLIIMPDGYDYGEKPLTDDRSKEYDENNEPNEIKTTSYKRWQDLEAAGAVFLPAAGCILTGFDEYVSTYNESQGCYWSSTPYLGAFENAGFLVFTLNPEDRHTDFESWSRGHSIRLVRDVE